MQQTLNDTEFHLFNDLITDQCGLAIEPARSYLLEKPITERITKLNFLSFQLYYNYISSPSGKKELSHLIQMLTVGETYFFRNQNHFKALSQYIFPRLSQLSHTIYILSAGCSTGEEAYSIVMLCKEEFPNLQFELIATDINQRCFIKAKKGFYSERSIKQLPSSYLKKYFSSKNELYQLDKVIIDKVRFIEGNLKSPEFYNNLGLFDLILCRNVLIYFSMTAVKSVISNFYSLLNETGFLILGHSETMQEISNDFEAVEKCGTFFYKKKSPQIDPPLTSTLPHPWPKSDSFSFEKTTKNLEINQKNILKPDEKKHTLRDLYSDGLNSFREERTVVALDIFMNILKENPCHQQSLLCIALLSANNGEFDQAKKYCQQALENEEFSEEAHFIRGLLYEYEEKAEEAYREYNTALFLKQDFALAHFKMGIHHLNRNKNKEALQSFKNTLKFLKKETNHPEENNLFFIYSGGFPQSTIQRICEQKIQQIK